MDGPAARSAIQPTPRGQRERTEAKLPSAGIPMPDFGGTPQPLSGEIQFTVPAGTVSYLSTQPRDATAPKAPAYLPSNWAAADVHGAGVIRRVGFDQQGGEMLAFTPAANFKGKFIVSLVAGGEGRTLSFDTEQKPGEAKPSPAALPKQAALPPVSPGKDGSEPGKTPATAVSPLKDVEWKPLSQSAAYSHQITITLPKGTTDLPVQISASGVTAQGSQVNHYLPGNDQSAKTWRPLEAKGNVTDDRWAKIDGAVAVRRQTMADGSTQLHISAARGFGGSLTVQVGGEAQTWTFTTPPGTALPPGSRAGSATPNPGVSAGYNPQYGCDVGAFLAELNAQRAQVGLRPVAFDHNLAVKASNNNVEQNNRNAVGHFWHDGSCAQCAAMRNGSEAAVISDWLHSDKTQNGVVGGHRAVLLDPAVTAIGIHRIGSFWTLTAYPSSTAGQAVQLVAPRGNWTQPHPGGQERRGLFGFRRR